MIIKKALSLIRAKKLISKKYSYQLMLKARKLEMLGIFHK